MKKNYLVYEVDVNVHRLSVPCTCVLCGKEAETTFRLKGLETLPSIGSKPKVSVKHPICKEHNSIRINSYLIMLLYHLICAAGIAVAFRTVTRNQNKGIYMILWLLFPFAAAMIWNVVLSPILINSKVVLMEFMYQDLQDIPQSVNILPCGDTIKYRFTNEAVANAFATHNGSVVKSITYEGNDHPFWRMILSVLYIYCSELVLFLVYSFIMGIPL